MQKKENRRQTLYYLGIGLGIIFIVAFFTSQVIMPLMFGRPKTITVPDVKNKSVLLANKILADNKLHAVVKDSVWSEEVASGMILSQKPESGQLIKPDGTVYLIFSRGSRSVKVPDVKGLNVQAAWIALKKVNLHFMVADSVYSELIPVNAVVETSPAAGKKVERGSEVKLFISRGPETGDDYSNDNDNGY